MLQGKREHTGRRHMGLGSRKQRHHPGRGLTLRRLSWLESCASRVCSLPALSFRTPDRLLVRTLAAYRSLRVLVRSASSRPISEVGALQPVAAGLEQS